MPVTRRAGKCAAGLSLVAAFTLTVGGVGRQSRGAAQTAPPTPFEYHFVDLGTLGGSASIGMGINDRGDVVGRSALREGPNHAFLWKAGRMTDLGSLPGMPYSEAAAINDAGLVICNAGGTDGRTRAFTWSNGRQIPLRGLSSAWSSVAEAVNSRGHIVGTMTDGKGQQHGFLLRGGAVSLLPMDGAMGVDDRDDVAGFRLARRDSGGPIVWTGMVWTDGRTRGIPLKDGMRFVPRGISPGGIIVGHLRTTNGGAEGTRGAIVSGGVVTSLELPPHSAANAVGVNDRRVAVGSVISMHLRPPGQAWLWRSGHGRPLSELTPLPAGWVLEGANAINRRGEIVGWGYVRGKPWARAFLLRPVNHADLAARNVSPWSPLVGSRKPGHGGPSLAYLRVRTSSYRKRVTPRQPPAGFGAAR